MRIKLDDEWHEKTECIYSQDRMILLRDWGETGQLQLWHWRSFNSGCFHLSFPTTPLDTMIYIILPSSWLESACLFCFLCTICLPSKLQTQLSAGRLCSLCPRREAGIKRLLQRKDICDPTGCDTEPLSLSLCHKHLSVCHKHTFNHSTVSKTKAAHATSEIMSAVVWGEGEKTEVNKNTK